MLGLILNQGGTANQAIDNNTDITGNIANILNSYGFWLLGAAAFGGLVYVGYLFITSKGDSGKLTTAKKAFYYIIIGLILATMAIMIINFLGSEANRIVNPGYTP